MNQFNGEKTTREKDQILKAGKPKDGAIITVIVQKQKTEKVPRREIVAS